MQMRFSASVWAMLSVGLEAESCEEAVECVIPGVCLRVRWRNYDGERHWKWANADGTPGARSCRAVQRMVWVRRDDRWHGEWVWEAYDRDEEWDGGVNRQWLNMRNVHQPTTLPSRGVDVPVEVLRYLLKAFYWVCPAVPLTTDESHPDYSTGRRRGGCSPQ